MSAESESGQWPADAEPVVSAEAVAAALDVQALRLDEYLPNHGPLTVVVMMNGGMYPAIELTRRMKRPLLFDYVHATRYRGRKTGRDIEWVRFPEPSHVRGDVLLIDDIFDEGYTMSAVRDRLLSAGADSVTCAVLAIKQHDRGLSRDWVDDHALEVPDRYVFGCGMDLHGHWRQIDAIWAVPA
jgi:hypoxanthine phosphoribosyltransferase